jgi:hypothetical protein
MQLGAAGPLGPSWAAAREREGEKESWVEPGGRERGSLYFYGFISLFNIQIQISFEFCLNLNF